MKIKLSILILCTLFLFSCKKSILKENAKDEIELSTAAKDTVSSSKTLNKAMGTLGASDYLSHIEDKFNGIYEFSILTVGPPRHIYAWQLLKDGIVIQSNSGYFSLYNQTGIDRPYEYITSLTNPVSGNYSLRLFFNGFWDGSNWVMWSAKGDFVDSDASVLQTTSTNVNVYRYWNGSIRDHFYTTVGTTFKYYQPEGIEFSAWNAGSGLSPVYRYYNNSVRDHYYTRTMGSYNGFVYEKIEFYIYSYQAAGTRPLYQYYNNSIRDHFYTVTAGSYNGYVYEGVLGYVN